MSVVFVVGGGGMEGGAVGGCVRFCERGVSGVHVEERLEVCLLKLEWMLFRSKIEFPFLQMKNSCFPFNRSVLQLKLLPYNHSHRRRLHHPLLQRLQSNAIGLSFLCT